MKTKVETEQLIYPIESLVSSLYLILNISKVPENVCCANIQKAIPNKSSFQVADFGGILSLFLGVSFISIWDNFHFLEILDILRSKCKKWAKTR